MNCKNCHHPLEDDDLFCENCGAKVIKDRITTKFLLRELLASFGWDSLYWKTLKKMFTKPQDVLTEYIAGTRKKYLNPFSHLLIGVALLLTVMNLFKKDFDSLMLENPMVKSQLELAEKDLTKLEGTISEKEMEKLKSRQESAKMGMKFNNYYFKYFNIGALLFIPFFAFLSKLTYRKPYNYGEHIIINAYLYGTSMYFSVILFFLALLINTKIYFASIFILIFYYLRVFSKIYKHSLGKTVLKLLRFLLLFILITTAFIFVLGIILGLVLIVSRFIT